MWGAERRAAGAIKAPDRSLETENLDLKAAEAEVKAARANKDGERLAAAEALLKSAERAKKTARQFLEWKQLERETRRAEERAAALALHLTEARRDVARAQLLARHRAPAAAKCDLAELAKTARRRRVEYDESRRRANSEALGLTRLEGEWRGFERLEGAVGRTLIE